MRAPSFSAEGSGKYRKSETAAFLSRKLGREERFRTVISGMEPRRIAVVMLLPRTKCLKPRHQGIAWCFFCQSKSLKAGLSPCCSCTSDCSPDYRARARTSVTSSGCSLSPIQFSTASITIWLISGRGRSRLSRTRSISRSSPNSPKSFSGSVTPSL